MLKFDFIFLTLFKHCLSTLKLSVTIRPTPKSLSSFVLIKISPSNSIHMKHHCFLDVWHYIYRCWLASARSGTISTVHSSLHSIPWVHFLSQPFSQLSYHLRISNFDWTIHHLNHLMYNYYEKYRPQNRSVLGLVNSILGRSLSYFNRQYSKALFITSKTLE